MGGVLLTGFEAFGSIGGNASWSAVAAAAERLRVEGVAVATAHLPVSYVRGPDELEKAVEEWGPDLVLAVGQAGGRCSFDIEFQASNIAKSDDADNDGRVARGEPLEPGGPDAYCTNLPVDRCLEAVRAAGVPAAESGSAGWYVCNAAFYRLMHLAGTRYPRLCGGFVHVPLMPAQSLDGARPTMPTELAAAGLAAMVRTVLGEQSRPRPQS